MSALDVHTRAPMPPQRPGRSRQDLLAEAHDRFWSKVDKREIDECWPWKEGLVEGYGWFYVGGGRASNFSAYAHRVALHYRTGEWGRVARHSCDNRACCNPKHLAWGTHKDNSQDAKDRHRAYVGEANSFAKFTEEQVREVRRLRADGLTYKAIGALVGAPWKRCWFACNGGWTHV